MSRKIPNASEMGKRGGDKVVKLYGPEHMSKIAKKGRENVLKNDPEFYKRLSEAGLKARMAKKKAKNSQTNRLAQLLTGEES
jgi:general stress protein YciG